MNRQVPINLLEINENWFDLSCTCIKRSAHVYNFLKLVSGVRQGGAMSPCLFAIFIDDIVTKLKSLGLGCNTILTCTSIFLYAYDIMLISPSVSMLQTMLHLCEFELLDLDMSHNVKCRSACALAPVLAKLNQCQNSLCSSLSANRVASELLLLRIQLSVLAQH